MLQAYEELIDGDQFVAIRIQEWNESIQIIIIYVIGIYFISHSIFEFCNCQFVVLVFILKAEELLVVLYVCQRFRQVLLDLCLHYPLEVLRA